jgi:hypothetical protein
MLRLQPLHFNFNNLKYSVCSTYISCVNLKLRMSIQSPSCKAINYTIHDENDHYIKKWHKTSAAVNSRKAKHYKYGDCYLKCSSQKMF